MSIPLWKVGRHLVKDRDKDKDKDAFYSFCLVKDKDKDKDKDTFYSFYLVNDKDKDTFYRGGPDPVFALDDLIINTVPSSIFFPRLYFLQTLYNVESSLIL